MIRRFVTTTSSCSCTRLLVCMLVASVLLRPSCAFNFLKRPVETSASKNSDSMSKYARENWGPATSWFSSRSLPLNDSPRPAHHNPFILLQLNEAARPHRSLDNEVLPDFSENQDLATSKEKLLRKFELAVQQRQLGITPQIDGSRYPHSASLFSTGLKEAKNLIAKLRQTEEIRQALRRLSKNERAAREEALAMEASPQKLGSSAGDDLDTFPSMDKQNIRPLKTTKSRRAKLGLLTSHGRFGNPLRISTGNPSTMFSDFGNMANSEQSQEGHHQIHSGFQTSFFDEPSATSYKQPTQRQANVEWFSDPLQKSTVSDSRTFGGYYAPYQSDSDLLRPSFESFGDHSAQGFPTYWDETSSTGGFSDEPMAGFKSEPISSDDGFGGFGVGFSEDDSQCENIQTKNCTTNDDCACNGFYECNGSKCVLLSSSSGSSHEGTWHDGPVDFGFRKRRAVKNKMAAVKGSEADLKH